MSAMAGRAVRSSRAMDGMPTIIAALAWHDISVWLQNGSTFEGNLTRTNVHKSKPDVQNTRALLCSCFVLERASLMMLKSPKVNTRIARTPTIIISSAITATDIASMSDRATQTGANCGRAYATKIPPTTVLIPIKAQRPELSTGVFLTCPTDHSKKPPITALPV